MKGSAKGGGAALDPQAALALEEGKAHFRAGRAVDAHAAFVRARRHAPSDPLVTSWLGVTLVAVERNFTLGSELADRAVRAARPVPELVLNQVRVAMAMGQRQRAIRALERGLARHPGSAELLAERDLLGRRRRPAIPFLSRSHVLNRWLGKLRHRWHSPADDAGREPALPAAPPDPERPE